MVKKIFIICITYIFLHSNLFGAKDIQIQEINKKINNDLLNLKKEYPKGQSVIYSVLDQISKMYQISKTVITKKRDYKKQFKAKLNEVEMLKVEIASLKKDLLSAKTEIESKNKNLAVIKDNLDKKDKLLSFINREKDRILKQNQSLKLTSTSDPMSPL